MTKAEVRKMNIKDVVNDPEWQSLRKSLVGTWKNSPVENIQRLRLYGGDLTDPLRLRRLLNYLTGSGFRLGNIRHSAITVFLSEVRIKWFGEL